MKRLFTFLLVAIVAGNFVFGQTNYFSVNANIRVLFSPGNLQYNAMNGTHVCADGSIKQGSWRFAEHQYEAWEDENASEEYDGWIDQFSWGTSGYNDKNPWGTSPAFPNENVNIAGTYYDWGVYNPILNAENQCGNWRTLTSDEFITLMQRDNSGKGGRAYVDGRQCLIFLPDNTEGIWTGEGIWPKKWKLNADESIQFVSSAGWNGDRYWNVSDADAINDYTLEQWEKIEQTGAILLQFTNTAPNWSDYGVDNGRRYWTATTKALSTANSKDPNGTDAVLLQYVQVRVYGEGDHIKSTKAFVRLVKDYQYRITTQSENTTYGNVQTDGLLNDGWAFVGDTITITAEPSSGCTFVQWSDGNTENPRKYIVTAPATFTAQFCKIETSDMPDINKDFGQYIPSIYLPKYFKVKNYTNYTFEAHSTNDGIVYPVVMGDSLGFIQYAAGNVTIDVMVSVGSTTASKSFNVTINPVSTEVSCELSVIPEIKDVTCYGMADGQIETTVSGGVEPYQFKWNTGRTSRGIYNVPKGEYSIIVTDANGCIASETFVIKEPSKIKVSETLSEPSCGESNGSIFINVNGGTGQYIICYNYDESTNSFAEITDNNSLTVSELSAGTYKIAVQDKQYKESCADTLSFSLSEKDAPKIELLNLKPSKCNEATGLIEVAYSGGEKPYSIIWMDGNKKVIVPNVSKRNVLPGKYTLTITDANNCKATQTYKVDAKPFRQPEISLVSYGEQSRKNIIAWQKEQTNEIDKYFIYRETERNGEYEKIGSLKYNENSVFVDETINPQHNSYRYRISAGNKCFESPLSHESKTINLQWERDANRAIHLWWDAYEGSRYITFAVYRLTRKGQFLVSEFPANKFGYIAEKPEDETIGYFVAVKLIGKIDINAPMKSESGPFIIVISNIAELENFEDAISEIPENSAIVYSKDKTIVIKSVEQNDVKVFDLTGSVIAQKSNVDFTTIPVQTAGVYIVIVGDRAFKVVVQ